AWRFSFPRGNRLTRSGRREDHDPRRDARRVVADRVATRRDTRRIGEHDAEAARGVEQQLEVDGGPGGGEAGLAELREIGLRRIAGIDREGERVAYMQRLAAGLPLWTQRARHDRHLPAPDDDLGAQGPARWRLRRGGGRRRGPGGGLRPVPVPKRALRDQ